MVRHPSDGGPYRFQHLYVRVVSDIRTNEWGKISYLIYALGADVRLNTEPEHGQYDPTDDAEVAEPESKRRPIENRERDMQSCANGPIGDHNTSDNDMCD